MHKASRFNIINPYLAACVALILTITLVTHTFFFTELTLDWVATLWFSLIFALLITIIQIARIEKNIKKLLTSIIN